MSVVRFPRRSRAGEKGLYAFLKAAQSQGRVTHGSLDEVGGVMRRCRWAWSASRQEKGKCGHSAKLRRFLFIGGSGEEVALSLGGEGAPGDKIDLISRLHTLHLASIIDNIYPKLSLSRPAA